MGGGGSSLSGLPGVREQWGDFHGCLSEQGPSGQGPSHPPAKSSAVGGHWGRPSRRHRAPPWGWGQGRGQARLQHAPLGGSGSAGPMAGQSRAVGSWKWALLWHHWYRGWQPRGAEMGPRAVGRVGEDPGGKQRQAGLWMPSEPWQPK